MDLRKILFKYRSYTPISFILLMVIFARPSLSNIVIGFAIVLVGEFLRLWGVSYAGSETRTTDGVGSSRLVSSGPFAYVRNPLYIGNILIYFGVGIMSWAGFPYLPIVTLLYFIFQYEMIVSLEEEHLAQKYGAEYQQYRKSVSKFIPSPKKYNSNINGQPKVDWNRGLKSENRTLQAILIIIVIIIILWIFDINISKIFTGF
jgi:protein-S-isoprenylcysteine O-methyltransferase Ste14